MTYKGYNEKIITLQKDGDVKVGDPVSLNSGNATPATSDSPFIGICKSVRGEFCGIQTDGYVESEYTGSAPSYGYVKLACAGTGKVKVKADADTNYSKVVMVDTENKIVGFIL